LQTSEKRGSVRKKQQFKSIGTKIEVPEEPSDLQFVQPSQMPSYLNVVIKSYILASLIILGADSEQPQRVVFADDYTESDVVPSLGTAEIWTDGTSIS
jgi:hypothetical protein